MRDDGQLGLAEPLVRGLAAGAEHIADLLPGGVGIAGDPSDLFVDHLGHGGESGEGVEVGGITLVGEVVGVNAPEVTEPLADVAAEIDGVLVLIHASTMDDRSNRVNEDDNRPDDVGHQGDHPAYGDLHNARERLCRAQMHVAAHWRSDLQTALDIIDQVGSSQCPRQWSRFDQPQEADHG